MDKHNIKVHVLKLPHVIAFLGPQVHRVVLITLMGSRSLSSLVWTRPFSVYLTLLFSSPSSPIPLLISSTVLDGINGLLYLILMAML